MSRVSAADLTADPTAFVAAAERTTESRAAPTDLTRVSTELRELTRFHY